MVRLRNEIGATDSSVTVWSIMPEWYEEESKWEVRGLFSLGLFCEDCIMPTLVLSRYRYDLKHMSPIFECVLTRHVLADEDIDAMMQTNGKDHAHNFLKRAHRRQWSVLSG